MRKLILLVLSFVLFASLCACTETGSKNYEKNTNLIEISGQSNLYYDINTKIVYFIFNECSGYQGYGYMSVYYAPNGFPYLYDVQNQTLIEIDGDGTI